MGCSKPEENKHQHSAHICVPRQYLKQLEERAEQRHSAMRERREFGPYAQALLLDIHYYLSGLGAASDTAGRLFNRIEKLLSDTAPVAPRLYKKGDMVRIRKDVKCVGMTLFRAGDIYTVLEDQERGAHQEKDWAPGSGSVKIGRIVKTPDDVSSFLAREDNLELVEEAEAPVAHELSYVDTQYNGGGQKFEQVPRETNSAHELFDAVCRLPADLRKHTFGAMKAYLEEYGG